MITMPPGHEEEAPVETLTYEQAFTAFEAVVAELEAESQSDQGASRAPWSLERSVAMFERGQALARRCSELLDRAELKVREISGETIQDSKRE